MRAADSVAETGCRVGEGRTGLFRLEESRGGVQYKHSSDNRGVWVINDPGAGIL